MTRNSKLSRVLLVAFGLIVSLVLSEAVLRFLPQHAIGYRIEGRSFRPPAEFERDLRLNSLGFHDVEPAPARPGTTRILLLGDSYVEANSVQLDRTVGRQLERYLESAAPGSYQVVSLGKGGWGQIDQYEALGSLGRSLVPDLVVTLFLGLNDVRDDSPELSRRQEETDRHLIHMRPGWISLAFDEAPLLFLKRSELNRFLSFRLAMMRARQRESIAPGIPAIPFDYYVYRTEYDEAWEHAWRLKAEIIEKTQALSERLGAAHLVVSASTPHGVWGQERGTAMLVRAFPAMARYEWDIDRPDRLLSLLCRERGLPLLLLEPRFREVTARAGERLHWPVNGHWNLEGNRLAGERIAEFVLQHSREQRAGETAD